MPWPDPGLSDLSHLQHAYVIVPSSFPGAELFLPGDSGAGYCPTLRASLASGPALALPLNGIYSLSDMPYLSHLAAYASPPLNARRTMWSLRRFCVDFALSFRYKCASKPKEGRVPSETLILFPSFRLLDLERKT